MKTLSEKKQRIRPSVVGTYHNRSNYQLVLVVEGTVTLNDLLNEYSEMIIRHQANRSTTNVLFKTGIRLVTKAEPYREGVKKFTRDKAKDSNHLLASPWQLS